MTTPHADVQRALVTRLREYPALHFLIQGRVYSELCVSDVGLTLPDGSSPAWPYLQIGDGSSQRLGSKHRDYRRFETVVNAWSRDASTMEARKIADAIVAALTDYRAIIAGNERRFRVDSVNIDREPFGKQSIGRAILRVII